MRIISIAGACSRAGKTALAESVLRAVGPGAAVAVKFTTTEDVFERCPRGTACVVCDIDVPFRIVEDPAVLEEPGTDTARLGAAGAGRVVWAIARTSAVRAAWNAVRARLGGAPLAVMEGSTIVHTARPDLLAFVAHAFLSPERWKPGTAQLVAGADAVIVNRPRAGARQPSAAVSEAIAAAGPRAAVQVGDVLDPLAAWAPDLHARVRGLARVREALHA